MTRQYKRRPDSRQYKCYTNQDVKKALQQITAKKMSLRKASKVFKIPLGTLSHKMNKKHEGKPGHPLVFTETEE